MIILYEHKKLMICFLLLVRHLQRRDVSQLRSSIGNKHERSRTPDQKEQETNYFHTETTQVMEERSRDNGNKI